MFLIFVSDVLHKDHGRYMVDMFDEVDKKMLYNLI